MSLGKTLILAGAAIMALGALVLLGERLGLGRLPGDFAVRGKNYVVYFPLGTSILLSVLLSLAAWLLRRHR